MCSTSRVRRLGLAALLLTLSLGCDPKAEPTVQRAPTAPASASDDPFNPPPPPDEPPLDPNAPDPAEPMPLEGEDEDPNAPIDPEDPLAGLDEDAPKPAVHSGPAPLSGDCKVRVAPKRVWPHAGLHAITAVAEGFVIAGYDKQAERETVFVVRLSSGALPQPLASWPLAQPSSRERVAAPGLTTNADGSVTVVVIDGQGAVSARTVATDHPNGLGPSKPIADGGDTRFAPAVTSYGQKTLVAWTDGRGTPMRVWTSVIDKGAVSAPVELTQTSMGAAAPTFLAGSNPPELLFVDPRAALSTLVRVPFNTSAAPGPAQVVVPINSLQQPPQIAAARGGNRTWTAYTAIGNAATTAIGLISIAPVPSPPEPLVAGTAYGALYVGAVATPEAAVFAADTPLEPGKDKPRRVHVTRATDEGRGAPTSLQGPSGTARHASIAAGEDGAIAVGFVDDGGVYVALLRCDSAS